MLNLKTRSKMLGLLLTIGISALTGCNNYKEQIAMQNNEIDKLQASNARNEKLLLETKRKNTLLRTDIAEKNRLLVGKEIEIRKLKDQKAKPADKGTEAPTGWEKGKYGDRVSIKSDLLFASGSAKLTTSGRSVISRIASQLKQSYPGKTVRVYGYTDSDPIRRTKHLWADNLDLSANRAMAVSRYLNSRGINKGNIETIAMGATNFVASNKTKSNKKRNRRVEIYVITNKK